MHRHPEMFKDRDGKFPAKWRIISDGGNYVRVRVERVQISHIILLYGLPINVITTVTYEPDRGSIKNPAERPHAVVNRVLSEIILSSHDPAAAQELLKSTIESATFSGLPIIADNIMPERFFEPEFMKYFTGSHDNNHPTQKHLSFKITKKMKELFAIYNIQPSQQFTVPNFHLSTSFGNSLH